MRRLISARCDLFVPVLLFPLHLLCRGRCFGEPVDDPREGLHKGKLIFKLRGTFCGPGVPTLTLSVRSECQLNRNKLPRCLSGGSA